MGSLDSSALILNSLLIDMTSFLVASIYFFVVIIGFNSNYLYNRKKLTNFFFVLFLLESVLALKISNLEMKLRLKI